MGLHRTVADRLLFGSNKALRRPEQIAFAESAFEAARSGRNAVLHAPTGIGKTRGLLAAGIEYVRISRHGIAIYAVRTKDQLFHVEREYERGWFEQADQREDGADGIRFGLALGIEPMQEKVCRPYFLDLDEKSIGHTCDGCVRQSARYLPCHVDGRCMSQDYHTAIDSGLCPYAFMLANLRQCNFIVATTGYVNSLSNMARIFQHGQIQATSLLMVDEAHSYLDSLGTTPMVRMHFGSDHRLYGVRQPDSELNVSGVRTDYAERMADAVTNTVLQQEFESLTGKTTQTSRDMEQLIRLALRANGRLLRQLKVRLGAAWKIRRDISRGEPIDAEWQLQTAHVTDPYGLGFLELINAAVMAKAAEGQWRATAKETTLALDEVSADIRELRQLFQGAKERTQLAWEAHNEAREELAEARFRKQAALEEKRRVSEKFEDARTAVKRCHDTKQFDLLDEYKQRRDHLFMQRRDLSATVGSLMELENAAKEQQKTTWKVYDNCKQLRHAAYHSWRRADQIRDNLRRMVDLAWNNKRSAAEEVHDRLREIDDSIHHFQGHIDSAARQADALRAMEARLHTNLERIREMLAGSPNQNTTTNYDALESLALQGASALDDLWNWGQRQIVKRTCGRDDSDGVNESSSGLADGIAAMRRLSESLASRHSGWLREIVETLSVIAETSRHPKRYWVSGPTDGDEASSGAEVIEVTDLDLGAKMSRLTGRYASVVLASGTLQPVRETAVLMGWPDAVTQAFESPFPECNYACYAMVGVHSGVSKCNQDSPRLSQRETNLLLSALPRWVKAIGRNTGVFVASEKMLGEVYQASRADSSWPDDVAHLVLSLRNQRLPDDYASLAREVGVSPKKSLGANAEWPRILQGDTSRHIVVWMAAAGKFAEGLDFPGRMLEAAILIGIPFPYQLDIEDLLRVRSEYYMSLGGERLRRLAEDLAWYVFPYRKLAQAAGRIHRSVSDTGTLVFADERLLGLKHEVLSNGSEQLRLNRTPEANRRSLELLPPQILSRLAVVVPEQLSRSDHVRILRRVHETMPGAPVLGLKEAIDHVRSGTHPRDPRPK